MLCKRRCQARSPSQLPEAACAATWRLRGQSDNMPAAKTTPPSPRKGIKLPAGPPLDYCFLDITSLDRTYAAAAIQVAHAARCRYQLPVCSVLSVRVADLSEIKPVGGFVKGQPLSAVQPSKPGTPLVPGSRPATANAEPEAHQQPVQPLATSPPKPVQYERNSLAIKLANNPLTSLKGLPEAAAAVLDAPVSVQATVACICIGAKGCTMTASMNGAPSNIVNCQHRQAAAGVCRLS